MRKIRIILGAIALILSLTSCFDIHEKVKVNADKSGEIMWYVENSGLGGMLAMMSGNSGYDEAISMIDSLAGYLANSKGITNVEYNLSPYQGDMYLKVDFEHSRYLNRAVYGFFGYSYLSWFKKYIKIKRHKVKRMNVSPFVKMYLAENETLKDYQSYLGSVKVISEIDLPGKIKKVEGENCRTEAQKVIQTFTLASILFGEKSTRLRIKFASQNDK